MTTKGKAEDDNEPPEPEPEEEPEQDEPGGTDRDELRALVREVLAEVLGDDGTADGEDGGDDGGGAGDAGRSPRDIEARTERAVKAAMAQLRKQDATESRIKQLEEKVREEAPRAIRRVTKLMWGADK